MVVGLAAIKFIALFEGGILVTVVIKFKKAVEGMATELLELRFRLYDGTDIGPSKFALTTTIASLKESIFAEWPREKDIQPRTWNDLKLINAGKVLDNNKTLAESRVPAGEIAGGVVTMHVVVQPSTADTGTDQHPSNRPTQSKCACTIL